MRRVGFVLFWLLGAALAQGIKVGVLAPLSGPAAADGKSVLSGIQIAAEEINAFSGARSSWWSTTIRPTPAWR